MNPDQESETDPLLQQAFSELEATAAPIDQVSIDEITARAADVFEQSSNDQKVVTPSQGRAAMITKIVVGLSTVAAGLFLLLAPPQENGDSVRLGTVLDKALQAKTLKLTLQRDGKEADVLVSNASLVRLQQTPQRYQISDGSKLWSIDETANQVSAKETPWHHGDSKQVELLSLIGLDQQQSKDLREATSTESNDSDAAKQKHVFTSTSSKAVVHAYLQADRLMELRCWPLGYDPQIEPRKLLFVARDVHVDESEFVVARKLSEDGRIGKITDATGTVTLRGVMNKRWTPVARQMLLKPGDWLRTDVRGANASTLVTTGQFKVVIGPASLVELKSPTELQLYRGEVKVEGVKGGDEDLKLSGPGKASITIGKGKSAHYRVNAKESLAKIDNRPSWLDGYEGTSTVDPVGSLIANIDGRETKLTIGFHKVSVEIRDQIARTTIEQSFVNHTSRRLEGIFHFPLPQDASISGFGMWIGNELVEADVVEKQRAREIYETILRERRDPGLLEWTGGNIFKARVFPIGPSSEKRIKIVYTQVLPLKGNRYRYSYGLRSEMLQTTPVRDLSIDVQLHSALPIRSIQCPTHAVRAQQTTHSAKLEFAAKEYTPQRDFELVCEVDASGKDVVVVPHRRGDDGYFMVQLTPPDVEGVLQRDLVADGKRLNLLLVCDTSGSMDSQKRRQQQQLVSTLLASLSDEDRFDLAFCDVTCDWLHDELVPPLEQHIDEAIDALEQRISLGWTDLDRMIESITQRSGQSQHVIYIGDGITTARDADPQAFVNRLQRAKIDNATTLHAVSLGSSFESVVLRALTSAGRGAWRHLGADMEPASIALELLKEISQPAIKDLKVEFNGLKVAAVYPDRLPNLPRGSQQILIGRYLPQATDQQGEIVVTGQVGDRDIRLSAPITLKDAESGNSFIPRLWARSHLDHLLAQGSSQIIRDQIIALSEEFHIITPYTSLLVLESDADRERFGVKRRFQMRDGERFFAEGRSDSNFELLQQQMKRSGDWRLALRRQILLQLTNLGRVTPEPFTRTAIDESGPMPIYGSGSLVIGSTASVSVDGNWFFGGGFGGGGGGPLMEVDERLASSDSIATVGGEIDEIWDAADLDREILDFESSSRVQNLATDFQMPAASQPARFSGDRLNKLGLLSSSIRMSAEKRLSGVGGRLAGMKAKLEAVSGKPRWRTGYDPYGINQQYVAWVDQLFPSIPPDIKRAESAQPRGSERALMLLRQLTQPITLADGAGIEVTQTTKQYDTAWERLSKQSKRLELWAADRWLHFDDLDYADLYVHWCDKKNRGVFSRAFQTGRTRGSSDADLKGFSPGHRMLSSKHQLAAYAQYEASVQQEDDDKAIVVLTNIDNPRVRTRLTIDKSKRVVLISETWNDFKDESTRPLSTNKYSDHKQIAGVWWPGKIESLDRQGKRRSEVSQSVRSLPADRFERRFRKELPDADNALLLAPPIPDVRQAHIAVRDGSAGVPDRLTLILDASLVQDWDAALRHLNELTTIIADKPCLPLIRAAVFSAARKSTDTADVLNSLADEVVAGKLDRELFLSNYLISQIKGIADHNESLRYVERLSDVFERQADQTHGRRLQSHRAEILRSLKAPEAMALQRELASSAPWDLIAQTLYAQDLVTAGDLDAAIDWLEKQIDDYPGEDPAGTSTLRNKLAYILRQGGRRHQLVTFMKSWSQADASSYNVHHQYLSALELANRTSDANDLALQWMKAAQVDGALDGGKKVRLDAAVKYALGQRYQTYVNWIEPIWRQPLADVAKHFLPSEHHWSVAQTILSGSKFRDTDECDVVRQVIADRLKDSAETLAVDHLSFYVNTIVQADQLPPAKWKSIAETLMPRWIAAEDESDRKRLGNTIAHIYRTHFGETKFIPFADERIERALAENRPADATAVRQELFSWLISRDWRQDYEARAARLVKELGAEDGNEARLSQQLKQLMRFVDQMLFTRQKLQREQLQAKPDPLTRSEYAAKLAEFQREAREGLVKTLSKHTAGDGELSHWIEAERMHLQVKLGTNLDQVAERCWQILGNAPTESDFDETTGNDLDAINTASKQLRKERAYAVLNYLAVRRSAAKKLTRRLQQFVQAGTQLKSDARWHWCDRQYALLIALDQPEQLHQKLSEWIRDDPLPVRWQRALARLEAERGRISEAITLMESSARVLRLEPQDHAAAANWYLVNDRRQQYEEAKVTTLMAMQEHELSQWLYQQNQRWWDTNTPLPTELDENVLFALRALFAQSSQPENYIAPLKQFYEASRDFRLLQMLPDCVLDRTPQKIYPLLRSISQNLMPAIRKEATTDQMLERIVEVRKRTDSPLDRRALDLLETMVERQAAKVINQPGPHIERAVAAMKRAFKQQWARGEIRQMAEFLSSLSTLAQQDLRAERLRQLRQLRDLTKADSENRFFVTWHMAHAIAWSHGDHDDGIDVMQAAIKEYRKLHPGGLPPRSNQAVFDYVRMLGYRGRFAEAEKFLSAEIESPLNDAQRRAYLNQRNNTYIHALRDGGQVSLGSSDALYENLQEHLLSQADSATSDEERKHAVDGLLKFYRTADDKSLGDAKEDLWVFAAERLPSVLQAQSNNYEQIIRETSDLIVRMLGKVRALDFLVQRFDEYPTRLTYSWNSPWRRFGYQMARWRKEHANELGDLEPRLLAVVLKELRRDLSGRRSQSRYMYGNYSDLFWKEKADDFAKVAEEIYNRQPGSARNVAYVANYVGHDLRLRKRAIEMLLAVNTVDPLEWHQLDNLVDLLHAEERFAEAIPILEPLVQARPDHMQHRTQLLTSYHRSNQQAQWDALLADTDKHFRTGGRWTEQNLAQLADVCLTNDYYAKAAAYYGELIPIYKRTTRRWPDYYKLSHYYGQQADAYSGLGQTEKAVDSACAAIIHYGRNRNDRRGMVYQLRQVLMAAKDLDQFVAKHDSAVDSSGQDNPLLRKQLGAIYANRNQRDKAIEQLRAAIALQPTDTETHQKLIEVLDAKGDSDGATRQALAMVDVDRHNLDAFRKLAERLQDDRAMSERAITTIVEAAPEEAEHHQAVAEIRQQQDRWEEAVEHWNQVALLRSREPNGLIKLAEAQIRLKRFDDARQSLNKLAGTEWPARFLSNVNSRVEQLTRQLADKRDD